MTKNEIACRYSQALFTLGKEKDKVISMREELFQIWSIIEKNDKLKQIILHPQIFPRKKKKVLRKIFKDQVSEQILNFLYLLLDKRREYFLETIIKIFDEFVDREEKVLKIEVLTAIDLNKKLKKTLHKKLEQLLDYTLIINNKVVPDIIGGMVIKIGNYIIDGSIENKLNSLLKEIEQIPVTKLGG